MAGIPFVFTIARVAEMLGEDEDWLHELSITMDPEDGHLWVLDAGEREVPAFTKYGIECLKEIITEEPATNRAPAATVKRRTLRFSPDAYDGLNASKKNLQSIPVIASCRAELLLSIALTIRGSGSFRHKVRLSDDATNPRIENSRL